MNPTNHKELVTMKKFLVGIGIVVLAIACSSLTPSARAQAPLGSDIITSATSSNYVVVLSSSTNATVIVTTNIVVAAQNNQRVRIQVAPDSALDGYVGYGPVGASNTVYLSGSAGLPLTHGNGTNVVIHRPALWKGPLTVTVSKTFTTNGTAIATFVVTEESGSF